MTLDRLNGWKEIAAYLGKSVRTVQRWERDYALPVRRLGRDGGEIVWASRAELDTWQVEFAARLHQTEPIPEADAKSQQPVPTRSARLHSRTIFAAVSLIGIIALVLTAAIRTTARPAQPSRATVEPEYLHVFDSEGNTLFSKHIPYLRKEDFVGAITGKPGNWAQFADLDGDGAIEVIFLGFSGEFSPEMSVFVFNADGTERFRLRPQDRIAFGTQNFAGPWRPHRVLIAPNGDNGPSLFVAFIGPLEFPTLVTETDANGRRLAEYWSNGHVHTIRIIPWRGRPMLFVGATHNDSRGASLAIFHDGKLSGSAPAVQAEYRCNGCGPGGPSEFLLFPRRQLALKLRGQSAVQDLRVLDNDTLHVNVGEGAMNPDGLFGYSVWYALDSGLTLANALFPSGVVAYHEELFAKGALPARFGPDDEQAVFPVQRWADGRFVPIRSGTVSH